jgi:hypothetical protein
MGGRLKQVEADGDGAAVALAQLTLTAAKGAVAAKGSFTLAVAGGSLIKTLSALKALPDVPWDKFHVFWVDERCVPHRCPSAPLPNTLRAPAVSERLRLVGLRSPRQRRCRGRAQFRCDIAGTGSPTEGGTFTPRPGIRGCKTDMSK